MEAALGQHQRCPKEQAGRACRFGFTLIELLAVILIIGLLMAILLPSLLRARLLAKRATCQGNLRLIGSAATLYESDFSGYVPICWANINPAYVNPWRSWRTSLLPYTPSFETFNCSAAQDDGARGELFHSAEEIAGQGFDYTINAGSYGVVFQYSLASYQTLNYSGMVAQGHPMWSCAFSTAPGVAWKDPANSIYVADAYLAKGPLGYPSMSYKGYGTSAIIPPSDSGYADVSVTRRFADRHCGANCLFVGGYVLNYATEILDEMTAGSANCVWDTD